MATQVDDLKPPLDLRDWKVGDPVIEREHLQEPVDAIRRLFQGASPAEQVTGIIQGDIRDEIRFIDEDGRLHGLKTLDDFGFDFPPEAGPEDDPTVTDPAVITQDFFLTGPNTLFGSTKTLVRDETTGLVTDIKEGWTWGKTIGRNDEWTLNHIDRSTSRTGVTAKFFGSGATPANVVDFYFGDDYTSPSDSQLEGRGIFLSRDSFAEYVVESHNDSSRGTSFRSLKSRGTREEPTAVLNGDHLGSFVAQGHDGTDYLQTPVGIRFRAIENFSGSTQATEIGFYVTASGAIAPGGLPISQRIGRFFKGESTNFGLGQRAIFEVTNRDTFGEASLIVDSDDTGNTQANVIFRRSGTTVHTIASRSATEMTCSGFSAFDLSFRFVNRGTGSGDYTVIVDAGGTGVGNLTALGGTVTGSRITANGDLGGLGGGTSLSNATATPATTTYGAGIGPAASPTIMSKYYIGTLARFIALWV